MKKLINHFLDEKYYVFFLMLILSPILFLPISSDIAIFIRAGKVIAEGGLIYHDFIDLKPAGFYYLYSLIYRIFTDNIILLRTFDLIIQTTTSILIYNYLKDIFTKKEAFAAGIIYCISYVGINYNQTMNSESFLGISLMIILILNRDKINLITILISGFLIGLNTGFKFTFGLLLPAYLIYLYLNFYGNLKKSLFVMLIACLSFAFTFLITLLPLLNSDSFKGFEIVISYLKFHSANPPLDMALIKFGIKETSVFFGDHYSILLSLSLFLGIFLYINKLDKENKLLIVLFLIFLLFSVAWERKFSIYHFSRIYAIFSIFSGIGLIFIFQNVKELFSKKKLSSKIAIIFFSLFLLIMSPITRYSKSYIPIKHFFTDKNKYFEFYELPNDNLNLLKTYKQIADYINSISNNNDKCIVIAIGAETINYYLDDKIQKSIFAHSLFYYGNFIRKNWYDKFNQEFKTADFLIIQNNDIHPMLTNHQFTSKELLENDHELTNYLLNNFSIDTTITPFIIFKRK